MTRKDYELVAGIIREGEQFFAPRAHARFALSAARRLQETNARFDAERFVLACRPSWVVGTTKESTWDNAAREARDAQGT